MLQYTTQTSTTLSVSQLRAYLSNGSQHSIPFIGPQPEQNARINELLSRLEENKDWFVQTERLSNVTNRLCFVCGCETNDLLSSLYLPKLWLWHTFEQPQLPSHLRIPTNQWSMCILHAFQRITEKQLTKTMKGNLEAYHHLGNFFKSINANLLRNEYKFDTTGLEFIGSFDLEIILRNISKEDEESAYQIEKVFFSTTYLLR